MKETFEKLIKSKYFKKKVISLANQTYMTLLSTSERPIHEMLMTNFFVSGWVLRNSKYVDKQIIPILSEKYGKTPLTAVLQKILSRSNLWG